METYSVPVQIRWADIDQNRHVIHSAYYDYGAMARIHFFNAHGLTSAKMEEIHVGPIIFREEALFRREIRLEDSIEIDLVLSRASQDLSKWSFRHRIVKADGTIAAILTLDGAWIHTEKRKLTAPGEFIRNVMDSMPKSEDFEWIIKAEASGK